MGNTGAVAPCLLALIRCDPAGAEAMREDLLLFVRNPLPPPAAATHGHGLALNNLRERLDLLYDGEARLRIYVSEGEFCAQVRLPVRTSVITPEPPQSAP